MQAAPLSRPEEVTMSTRRIVASVCALALAVPAAAAAVPAHDPSGASLATGTGHTVSGDTKYDLQNKQDLAPKGDTKSDVTLSYADKVGALPPEELAAAYGTTKIDAKPVSPRAAVIADDGDTNGWRIAAIAEAGLLAAIALGSAALVGRRRPRHGAVA
jgi:hypothetical protein